MLKPENIQQLVSGFRTTLVVDGPCVVRVHEALDSILHRTPHRYFVSVDLKFRPHDILNLGQLGHAGCTKSEATHEANLLAKRIYSAWTALNAATEQMLKWDTATNRYTQKLQQEAFNKIVGRYSAELEAV